MFVTFEGIDGSGKSTQIAMWSKSLKEQGIPFVLTREPGGTPIGGKIRQILLDPEHRALSYQAELLLYLADRVQHLQEVIEPALQAGKWVLCDRYHDATLAYQGYGRQLDLSWLHPLAANLIRKPDRTLWFKIPPQQAAERLALRSQTVGGELCRIEQEKIDFFQRIHHGYVELAKAEPERFRVINAALEIHQVQAEVQAALTPLLSVC